MFHITPIINFGRAWITSCYNCYVLTWIKDQLLTVTIQISVFDVNEWIISTLLAIFQLYHRGQLHRWRRVWVGQRVKKLDYLTTHTTLSPIRRRFAPGFVDYKKGCTRLVVASDKVYQLLAHGLWFSPGKSPWNSWNIARSVVKNNTSINQSINHRWRKIEYM